MLISLLIGTLGLTYLLVRSAARATAVRQIEEKTDDAARVFERLLREWSDELALAGRLLSSDFAFASTFGQLRGDDDPVARATLRSALENYRGRIDSAAFLRLVSLDGDLLADTLAPGSATADPLDPAELMALEESPRLGGMTVQRLEGRLFLVIIRPLLLPDPAAWILIGFPLDAALAEEFRQLTGFEIGFLYRGELVASTPLLRRVNFSETMPVEKWTIGGENFLGRTVRLPNRFGGDVEIAMLRSLDREMAPFARLERAMLLLNALALGAAVVVCAVIARGVTRPVERLSHGAARIERGDYAARVAVRTRDELGQLGVAFNHMAAGLEERDLMRDLLGKTVSPQIATALVNSRVELGGELREVTILFSDLRGFTAFSETQAPAALLAQLNAYFTATIAAVEDTGGIVDKLMGDAIMAIFGAPVAFPDHADRALAAARGILRAEEKVNAARAAADLPPLRTGIGIATGQVVAGNVGAPHRYNYTVVGNEVNLASRLESMTKEARFHARIVCSDRTRAALQKPQPLRDLGETAIRGKAEAIRMWAAD